jgi:hypothetical protein
MFQEIAPKKLARQKSKNVKKETHCSQVIGRDSMVKNLQKLLLPPCLGGAYGPGQLK